MLSYITAVRLALAVTVQNGGQVSPDFFVLQRIYGYSLFDSF